jgi:Flp pilus assembly protein TadG
MQAVQRLRRLVRRFAVSRRGVAAVEFAMVLPVLAVLFLGSFDAGRALTIYMKVRAATYSLAAITNQYQTMALTDMQSVTGATSVIMSPYPSSSAAVTVSQITVASASSATVAWSYSLNGTALAQNATVTLPTNLYTCGTYPCYLIYGQVSYPYTPMFGYFTSGTLTLSDSLYVTPRSSACVIYTPATSTACAVASSGSSGSGSSGSGSSGSGSSGSGSSGSGSSGSGSSGSGFCIFGFCFSW